jgi:hypothetical protein
MWTVVFALLGGLAAQEKAVEAPKSSLKLEYAIPMPGVEGRIDHMAHVSSTQRLYIAALENGSVVRMDLQARKVIGEFARPGEPQGALYYQPFDAVIVTDGELGALWVCVAASTMLEGKDVNTGKKELVFFCNKVAFKPDADNIRFLPKADLIVVGFGEGGLALVEPITVGVVATIELGAHPESFQIDADEKRAWVNVPEKQSIAVVDLEKKQVARWIEVKNAKKNYPMALAEKDKRVIIGCREPARLLLFDMETDAPAGDLPLSGDVDDIFVDEERGLLYASCGEGFVDVFERKAPGAWMLKEKVATAAGARTCLFVPSEKKLFVAVPHRGEQRAEVRVFSTAP